MPEVTFTLNGRRTTVAYEPTVDEPRPRDGGSILPAGHAVVGQLGLDAGEGL